MRFEDIPLMDQKWKGRPLSNLVKWMLVQGNVSYEDAAKQLNISSQYLSNKMNRGSFSVFDILKLSEICGCQIDFSVTDTIKWNPIDFYDDPDYEEEFDE